MPTESRIGTTTELRAEGQRASRLQAESGPLLRTLVVLAVLANLIASSASHLSAQSHRIFVTSTTGPADLSMWPDAGGESGLAAADRICRAHAERGNLAGASSYVAWISDSVDDAYCRVHGLTGTLADDCGEAQRPAGAGPWQRMDGLPFGGPAEDLLPPDRAVLSAVEFDEAGQAVYGSYFTGTRSSGEGTASICSDWTSTSSEEFAGLGGSRAAGRFWTDFGVTSCSSQRSLLCLRSGPGPALAPPASAGNRVFITGKEFLGDLGSAPEAGGAVGVAAGDAICRQQAELFDLDNAANYKAWLSDTSTAAIDRLDSDGPWVRLDGMPVADDVNDLIDGLIRAPLNLTVDGRYLDRPAVWTGTSFSGQPLTPDCDGWTSSRAEDLGRGGETSFVTSFWTEFPFDESCANGRHLICMEDTTATGGCRPDGQTLCLGSEGRFAVRIEWETGDDAGAGQAVDIGRQDSGLFTFFDPNNLEMLVKVLDGCGLTGHYWVFYGATTDVGFRLSVVDSATEVEVVYTNPLGRNAESVKDLFAFPCASP